MVDKAQPPDFDSWREAKIKILQAGQVKRFRDCVPCSVTSLALDCGQTFSPLLLTKRGLEEASLVLKMQRPCSTGLPG